MEVEPLTLEELVEEATDINNYASNDVQAQAVSNQVNRTIGGASTVVKLLIQKLAMRQEVVTLQVLNVAEICVKNCGVRFHNEIGKYRFINELIKLLSAKYDGDITPFSVKERVINLMFSWYVGLPHEMKIGEAYKMLKQQGIIKRDPVDPNRTGGEVLPRETDNTAFQDEGNTQLLKTLLSSKDAEDLHSANKLIKNMVKEEEERLDRVSNRIQVLETVANNVKLLDDMIGKYEPTRDGSDLEIMNELYERCLTLRPELFRLASKNVDDQDDSVAEILSSSDELTRVIDSYKERVLFKRSHETNRVQTPDTAESLSTSNFLLDLDLNSPIGEANGERVANSLLDEQFKLLGLSTPINETSTRPVGGDISTRPALSGDISAGFPALQTNWNANHTGVFDVPQMNGVSTMFSSLPSSSNMLPNNMIQNNVFNAGTIPQSNPKVASSLVTVAPPPAASTSLPRKDLFDFDIFESDFLKVANTSTNTLIATTNINNTSNTNHLLPSTQNIPIINQHPPIIASSNTVNTSNLPCSTAVLPTGCTRQEPTLPPSQPAPVVKPAPTPVYIPLVAPVVVSNVAPTPGMQPAQAQPVFPATIPAQVQNVITQPAQPQPVFPATIPAQIQNVITQPAQPQPVFPATIPAQIQNVITQPAPASLVFPATIPAQIQNVITQPAPASPVNYLVPLEALKSGKYAPIPILDKDGLKSFLIIAEDARDDANPNVIVSILSTISLNANPLTAFSIQVAVPKVMRVKLQPATTNDLAPFNPLLPPPSISQVMLIANPTKETVKMRFKIVYTLAGISYVETANIDQLPVR